MAIAVREFEVSIQIVSYNTSVTIKKGYEAFTYIGNVRQTVIIQKVMNSNREEVESISIGDRAILNMKFKCKPEFILPQRKIVFREGRTRGFGIITKIIDR